MAKHIASAEAHINAYAANPETVSMPTPVGMEASTILSLMNLLAKMKVDPKHVEVKSMVDWCYMNDSDKARTICPQHAALKAAGHKAVVMPVHHAAPAPAAPVLAHDVFHTHNIDVNQIDSAGNVDIGLMNLLAKVDPKHVEIKSMVDWCYKNDSAKAKKICPHHAAMKAAGKKVAVVAPEMAMPALDLTHDVFHTQNIDVNQIDSAGNVDIKIMMI